MKFFVNLKKILDEAKIPYFSYQDQGNIISVPTNNPEKLSDYLKSFNIYIKPLGDVARISFRFDSSIDDFVYVVKKIKEWLEKEQAYTNQVTVELGVEN